MNEKITLQDIVDLLVERQNIAKKDAEVFVKAMFDLIEEILEREKYLKVKGLGAFKLIKVENRESVNVNTGERFEIQGHSKISFTPDSSVRDLINKPFAHFESVPLNEETVLENTVESTILDSNEFDEDAECIDSLENPVVLEDKLTEFHPVDIETKRPQDVMEETLEVGGEPEKTSDEASVDENAEQDASRVEHHIEITEGESTHDTSNTKVRKSWYVFVILLGVVVFVGYRLYQTNEREQLPKASMLQEPKTSSGSDSIIPKTSEVVDTLLSDKEKITEEVNAIAEKKEQIPEEPLSPKVNYEMVGVLARHTINSGETLRKISLKYYGTKELFSYIVNYNSDVIKNPDNVPVGTVLKIPELKQK